MEPQIARLSKVNIMKVLRQYREIRKLNNKVVPFQLTWICNEAVKIDFRRVTSTLDDDTSDDFLGR